MLHSYTEAPLAMSDISTFGKFKDWAIIGLIALVSSLLGLVASDNRGRIHKNTDEIAQMRQEMKAIYIELAVSKVENTALRREVDRLSDRITDRSVSSSGSSSGRRSWSSQDKSQDH